MMNNCIDELFLHAPITKMPRYKELNISSIVGTHSGKIQFFQCSFSKFQVRRYLTFFTRGPQCTFLAHQKITYRLPALRILHRGPLTVTVHFNNKASHHETDGFFVFLSPHMQLCIVRRKCSLSEFKIWTGSLQLKTGKLPFS